MIDLLLGVDERELACVIMTKAGVALGATARVELVREPDRIALRFPEPMTVEWTGEAAEVHLLHRSQLLLKTELRFPAVVVGGNTMTLNEFDVRIE